MSLSPKDTLISSLVYCIFMKAGEGRKFLRRGEKITMITYTQGQARGCYVFAGCPRIGWGQGEALSP